MSGNSRLKATLIVGQKKAFYRQRIRKSSSARKETADINGKAGKEIPESPRLEFFRKFFANNFALSDADDKTSRPLNIGGIADLPLLRTLLAIRLKS